MVETVLKAEIFKNIQFIIENFTLWENYNKTALTLKFNKKSNFTNSVKPF